MKRDRTEYNRAWREKNKEHRTAYTAEYRKQHKEEIAEKQKEYHQKNKEARNIARSKHKALHRGYYNEYNRAYYELHQSEIREQAAERYYKITRPSTETSPEKWLYNKIKTRAKLGRREFQLTLDQLIEIYDNQHGLCAITGIPMTTKYGDHKAISIDRIKSEYDYIPGNVQLVCTAINLAKKHHSQESILAFVELIRNTKV